MNGSYFVEQTVDDMMRTVISAIISEGVSINPTKGASKELTGVLLEIKDPRARLSRTEKRGRVFSCIGELCWYLSKSNSLDFISYYIPRYKEFAEDGVLFGGYGPRMFCQEGINQVDNVINLLKRKRESRQAVIQLFSARDIAENHKDVPCTCTLQFMIRNGVLYMMTYMRSNDVYLGLPHDVFSFTFLQEIIAATLSVDVGCYKHAVGSLHLYDKDLKDAKQFLDEGWQQTISMPPMPHGDPWPAIKLLLEAEACIRNQESFDVEALKGLDPYWMDIIRLLQIFSFVRGKDSVKIREVLGHMHSDVYNSFVNQRLRQLL